jgi:hypothetical protein
MRDRGGPSPGKAAPLLLFLVLFSQPLSARAIEGATVPEQLEIQGRQLILNGAGMREKWIFDIYAAALYLERKTRSAERVLTARQPMAIRLQLLSRLVDREAMAEAAMQGFSSSTGGDIGPIRSRVDRFVSVFTREDVVEGDVFEMVYLPGCGVRAYKNGRHLSTIEGWDFKKALFGIWLSDDPVQRSLKRELLGYDR